MTRARLEDAIRQELETIAYQMTGTASLEERLARWRDLFDQAGGHEGVRDIEFTDADQLLGWGFALAMDAGQYHQAVQTMEPLLRHPDFEHEPAYYRAHLMSKCAAGLLFADEMAEAVAMYRSVFEVVQARPGYSRSATLQMWHELRDYCLTQPESASAPSELAQLIYDVVFRRSARVRRAAPRYEPTKAATYAELLALLSKADRKSQT